MLNGGLRILAAGNHQRDLDQPGEQHVGKQVDLIGSQAAGLGGATERGFEETEAMLGLDLAPFLPAQRGGGVDQRDLANALGLGKLEEGFAAGA